MIKNFEDKIILTSQNPEAFLVFSYDGVTTHIDASISPNIENNLYINGWDVSTLYIADTSAALILTTNKETAAFHIFTDSNNDFEYNLRFNLFSDQAQTTLLEYVDVSIINRPFLLSSNEFNNYQNFNPLVDNEASYLLLRSNPKYSGNIKLVIDESSNLFLDTFKVSDILSNKKYRKQRVSGNSFLSGDIRTVFSSIPQGEIFRVGNEDTFDLTNPKTEYSKQFNSTYDYGARMLVDELYSEEYSIFAPLWVNSKIPDYFVIFKLDGTFNDESYGGTPAYDNLAKKYISEGELLKSWNLKENTEIGKYFNNHLSELLKIEAPVNLSLNPYDPNTWYGIAIDKGIITGRSEVPYFFEQTTDNLTKLNAFVSQGFERNNLICPNLLNIEYIFNDRDASLYTMNRYFGLYLSENELFKFTYYSDTSTSNINIIPLDTKDVSVFINSPIFDGNGDVSTSYSNRIFVLNTGDNLERISNIEQFNGTREFIESYVNKLGENIFNTPSVKKELNSFITLKINSLIHQGEHLRIINKTQNKIWEIYGTDSDIFEAGECGPYVAYNEPSTGYPNLYRTSFSTKGTISDEIISIKNAITLFDDYNDCPFIVGSYNNDSLSIILKETSDDVYLFQRITAQISYPIGESGGLFNSAAGYNDISFYNIINPTIDDFSIIQRDSSYGPINFELYGDRMSIIINFINTANYYTYSFDSSIYKQFSENILYKASDGWNRLIQTFDISTAIEYNVKIVEDPIEVGNKILILTENEIELNNGILDAYDVYPISISLMGINPVKYLDSTVYDSANEGMTFKSDYFYKREDDEDTYNISILAGQSYEITNRNSYEIISGSGSIVIDGSTELYSISSSSFLFNTFFNNAQITASSNTIITYNDIDGSQNYTSYDDTKSEESIYDYYLDSSTKTLLKYGLTIPTISKWGGIGQDSRNNDVRLMLSSYLFDDPSAVNSNFIPTDSLYSDEISYPIFKYLTPGEDNWKEYVYYDINDVIDTSTGRKSIRNIIFEEPYYDIFSKILYNNNGISGNSLRSSILYYNLYENKIIGIIKGLKLGVTVTSHGEKQYNIVNWNRYRFSFISSPSRCKDHNKPIEVIINENTKTILIIWYQGNDVLSYSKRNSNYLPGKNNLIDINSTGNYNFTGFVTNDASYSYSKSPFYVNNSRVVTSIYDMYDILDNYDTSICSPFAQFNYNNINKVNSIFNAYDENYVNDNVFTFPYSYNTFNNQYVNYTYFKNSATYNQNVSNIAYNYLNNDNYYKNITCSYSLLKEFIENNNVYYYIIQEDTIVSSNNFTNPPIELYLFDPISYSNLYTYNGGYKPIFKNVLNFEDNEEENIINYTENDYVFANTNLDSYDYIDQFWINRVVDTVSTSDSSNNIIYLSDYDPFKSLWDAGYFVKSVGNVNVNINGFNSDLEIPSLFGSKLISIPEEIILDSWNASNSKIVNGVDYYSLEFNLSKSILDLFSNSPEFINNWNNLSGVTNDIINRYILKTILTTYNISIEKIQVEVKSKIFNTSVLGRIDDGSYIDSVSNINSILQYENNEYIYKIRVKQTDNKSYFVKFKFNRK